MAMQIPKPKQLQALGLTVFKAGQKLVPKAKAITSSRTTGKRKTTRARKPKAIAAAA